MRTARWCVLSVLAALVLAPSAGFAIDVIVNGEAVPPYPPAIEVGGRVLLPLRNVFVALEADVTWDAATMSVTAVRGGTTVKMTIGDPTAYVNGRPTRLDVPSRLINERTYIPVRFPAEAFGAEVRWDGATQTVFIVLAETAGPPAGGGLPQGAPIVLAPQNGARVGTRTEVSIRTTPGVQQVIWTVVFNADSGEVLDTVPGIRHLPNEDGTYRGAIATPRISVGDTRVPLRYEIHFRNGPNPGDPETVITVYPND